ncbi:glutathione S-transferase family protein [Paraliomyxa miuraensis]|uniref:glutathione S-transferase family protein n=1 Tax=Paraliomyxa miuraensis TaxID=376150 RepID=UPI002252E207|nr:glutathione S-transferase N-terminal domain-containing protein [Paraliomyxa miuraensis]MCX4246883.1 glutathione S-transferase N-terminal domain-containing protein [Paraliomyxa miuraensis]
MTMRLFGTTTSPYVRRVRIVALELGVPFELVDVFSEGGQAAMRAVNPLWKVPTVEIDGRAIFDSRVIDEHLMRTHGPGPLAPLGADDVEAHNVCTVIDGALDALINAFYLARDGVTGAQAAYVTKQHERAAASLAWLEARVDDVWLTRARAFGLPEIALCTALEWMRFRDTYPVDRHAALVRCVEHHGTRESLVATRPHA